MVLAKNVPAQDSGQITAWTCPASTRPPATPGPTRDGSVAANIIGFTGTDSHGTITGGAGSNSSTTRCWPARSGSEQVQLGDGQQIPLPAAATTPAVNGSSLRLTIVPALQYAAEQACAAQVKKTKADNCTVVIINPHTGAVLAMAQYPTYDPSDVTNVARPPTWPCRPSSSRAPRPR